MDPSSIEHLSGKRLARLLDLQAEHAWDRGDAPAILKHQLEAPLLADLMSVPGAEVGRLRALLAEQQERRTEEMRRGVEELERADGGEGRTNAVDVKGGSGETFLRELTKGRPAVELLRAIKAFARAAEENPSHPLRGGPASVLYYAAIAAARWRCGTRMTQLADEQVAKGVRWAMEQPGAEGLREVFEGALRVLEGGSPGAK